MVDIEVIRSWLSYAPETGVLRWNERVKHSRAGMVAGLRGQKGYVVVSLGGQMLPAHRVAWALVHGEWPSHEIDHINRIRWDNRLSNLRPATKSQNGANRAPHGATSKFKGVSWHKKSRKWRAQIKVNGKKLHLGSFASEAAAAKAYDLAASQHFGQFAYLNFGSGAGYA